MKTLHIFHNSDLKNGVDKTTCTLMVALKKLGVEPIATVPKAGNVTEYLQAHSIRYWLIPYSCCASRSERAQLMFYGDSFAQLDSLITLIHQETPDIIHINTGHLLHAGIAAARQKIPTIWHIHAPFAEDLTRYDSTVGTGGYIHLLKQLSSQIIGVSEDVNKSLSEHLPPDRIETLYNGIDIDELLQSAKSSSTDIRTELGLSADAKLVIGVGRISAQKDFAAFARIAAKVRKLKSDCYFVVAGPRQEPAAVSLLENEVAQNQLSNRLFILGPRDDIAALLAQSTIFLSTAIFEGQGIAALEAMALDTPPVAMACAGLRECIAHEHDGILVDPGDEDTAAAAILRLLDNPELVEKLTTNARISVAKKFSSREYAKRFLSVADAAIAYGPATMSSQELDLLSGLLAQINNAHLRLLNLEQQTLGQRIKGILWELRQKLKAKSNTS
jgi:glycosyltransferase involved in cell wall biosynthesis